MAYQVIERSLNGWTVVVSEKSLEAAEGKKGKLSKQRKEVIGVKRLGYEYSDSVTETMPGWPRNVKG